MAYFCGVKTSNVAVSVLALAVAGCSGSSDDPSTPPGDSDPTGEQTPQNCENTLTDFKGDCWALEAPPTSEGFQLHYGPSDYSDPAELEKYILQPGEEVVDCLHMTTPNDTEVFFSDWEMSARFGTHHIILWEGGSEPLPDGTLADCPLTGGLNSKWTIAMQSALQPGATGASIAVPGDIPIAPENEGLARRLPANAHIAYQVHFVNTTSEPILRESWANFRYRAPEEVEEVIDTIDFIGGLGLNIPPRSKGMTRARSCAPPVDTELRVVNLIGHMHAHGKRFTAWKVDQAGNREKVYETFSWSEADNIVYDSMIQNPEPDATSRTGGGTSGPLTLVPGEFIEWECEFENDLDIPLVWANEAYTAEMCNLVGQYTPSAGGPWSCFEF